MATLKEIAEKYGFGCKIKWKARLSGTTYIDTLIKSPEKSFDYRLIGISGTYTDFSEESDFQVEYVSGGDKNQGLDLADLQTIGGLCSKVMNQLKKEVSADINDYIENDLPELINDLLTKKGCVKLNDKITNLADIAQILMNLTVLIDDYIHATQEIKK
jgi:hypothetical protein